MTIRYLLRILFYFAGCLAVVALVSSDRDPARLALVAWLGTALLYALPLVKGLLFGAAALVGRYSFMALVFRSLIGLLVLAVLAALVFPLLLTAAVLLGMGRMAWHLVLAIQIDLNQDKSHRIQL